MSIILSATADLFFQCNFPGVCSDGNYIYYAGVTSWTSPSLSGHTFRSSDGITWERTCSAGPVSFFSRLIYFNGTFFLLQHLESPGTAPAYATSAYSSTDCTSWSFVGYLPYSTLNSRNINIFGYFSTCIHNSRIYITGSSYGSSYGGFTRAVISTTNFVNFTIHQDNDASNTFSKRFGSALYSKNGNLYLLRGINDSNVNETDLWKSEDDGYSWTQINTNVSNTSNMAPTWLTNYKNFFSVYDDFYIGPQYAVRGSPSNNPLQYTTDGENFISNYIDYLPGSGNNIYNPNLVYHRNRLHAIGGLYYSAAGPVYISYRENYISVSAIYPSSTRVSFENTVYHSPSPAYIRLTDTSNIGILTSASNYLRIWKTVNDRTSATTYYQTSASYLDLSVSGVYGDTISISLSAVF